MWLRTGQFRQDLENNFIYVRLMNRNIFEKSNLRVQRNNTLNLECIKRPPWSVFRKPQFLHTFSNQGFLITYHGFLWTRKLLFSRRKHQIYEFRKNLPALNSNTNLQISRHLALITHDATMRVNSSIEK